MMNTLATLPLEIIDIILRLLQDDTRVILSMVSKSMHKYIPIRMPYIVPYMIYHKNSRHLIEWGEAMLNPYLAPAPALDCQALCDIFNYEPLAEPDKPLIIMHVITVMVSSMRVGWHAIFRNFCTKRSLDYVRFGRDCLLEISAILIDIAKLLRNYSDAYLQFSRIILEIEPVFHRNIDIPDILFIENNYRAIEQYYSISDIVIEKNCPYVRYSNEEQFVIHVSHIAANPLVRRVTNDILISDAIEVCGIYACNLLLKTRTSNLKSLLKRAIQYNNIHVCRHILRLPGVNYRIGNNYKLALYELALSNDCFEMCSDIIKRVAVTIKPEHYAPLIGRGHINILENTCSSRRHITATHLENIIGPNSMQVIQWAISRKFDLTKCFQCDHHSYEIYKLGYDLGYEVGNYSIACGIRKSEHPIRDIKDAITYGFILDDDAFMVIKNNTSLTVRSMRTLIRIWSDHAKLNP